MSECMYNSNYDCGVNPKGGCWNCDQFKSLDKFIVQDGEYVLEKNRDICIDGDVFRRLADEYVKKCLKKAKNSGTKKTIINKV